MRVTRHVKIVLFVVLAALFAAGCGDDGESGSDDAGSTTTAEQGGGDATTTTEAPTPGGVITMGTYTEPSGLDPVVAQGGGTSGNHEMSAIYGTLMRYDRESGEYVPSMAESLTTTRCGR
jgi:peptide/nickel transport system substrate-binding protein